MLTKSLPSSGFDELVYDGYSFRHYFHTSEGLSVMADKEKGFQLQVLADIIQNLIPERVSRASIDSVDVLYFSNKLPKLNMLRKRIQQ